MRPSETECRGPGGIPYQRTKTVEPMAEDARFVRHVRAAGQKRPRPTGPEATISHASTRDSASERQPDERKQLARKVRKRRTKFIGGRCGRAFCSMARIVWEEFDMPTNYRR